MLVSRKAITSGFGPGEEGALPSRAAKKEKKKMKKQYVRSGPYPPDDTHEQMKKQYVRSGPYPPDDTHLTKLKKCGKI